MKVLGAPEVQERLRASEWATFADLLIGALKDLDDRLRKLETQSAAGPTRPR
jgi:hypothetical protein